MENPFKGLDADQSLDSLDEIRRSQSVSPPILVKSEKTDIVYCSGDCALSSGEREEDLEPYTPESSAFTAQCVGCGELI